MQLFQYPYQPTPVSHSSRLFKPIAPRSSSHFDDSPSLNPKLRSRVGRGGRRTVDRSVNCRLKPAVFDKEHDPEVQESLRRMEERFRYDGDEGYSVGPPGVDEHDRKLIDEVQARYAPSKDGDC